MHVRSPAAAAAEAASSNPAEVLSVLFPPRESAAAQAYAAGILRYPDFYLAPRAAVAAQGVAVEQWVAGNDPAGLRFATIRLPLSGGRRHVGSARPERQRPLPGRSVPGAKLVLYPGAAHGFLFQDMSSFLPAVERFLR